jgi:hypothetical protein
MLVHAKLLVVGQAFLQSLPMQTCEHRPETSHLVSPLSRPAGLPVIDVHGTEADGARLFAEPAVVAYAAYAALSIMPSLLESTLTMLVGVVVICPSGCHASFGSNARANDENIRMVARHMNASLMNNNYTEVV